MSTNISQLRIRRDAVSSLRGKLFWPTTKLPDEGLDYVVGVVEGEEKVVSVPKSLLENVPEVKTAHYYLITYGREDSPRKDLIKYNPLHDRAPFGALKIKISYRPDHDSIWAQIED